jgi:hypothetical protein
MPSIAPQDALEALWVSGAGETTGAVTAADVAAALLAVPSAAKAKVFHRSAGDRTQPTAVGATAQGLTLNMPAAPKVSKGAAEKPAPRKDTGTDPSRCTASDRVAVLRACCHSGVAAPLAATWGPSDTTNLLRAVSATSTVHGARTAWDACIALCALQRLGAALVGDNEECEAAVLEFVAGAQEHAVAPEVALCAASTACAILPAKCVLRLQKQALTGSDSNDEGWTRLGPVTTLRSFVAALAASEDGNRDALAQCSSLLPFVPSALDAIAAAALRSPLAATIAGDMEECAGDLGAHPLVIAFAEGVSCVNRMPVGIWEAVAEMGEDAMRAGVHFIAAYATLAAALPSCLKVAPVLLCEGVGVAALVRTLCAKGDYVAAVAVTAVTPQLAWRDRFGLIASQLAELGRGTRSHGFHNASAAHWMSPRPEHSALHRAHVPTFMQAVGAVWSDELQAVPPSLDTASWEACVRLLEALEAVGGAVDIAVAALSYALASEALVTSTDDEPPNGMVAAFAAYLPLVQQLVDVNAHRAATTCGAAACFRLALTALTAMAPFDSRVAVALREASENHATVWTGYASLPAVVAAHNATSAPGSFAGVLGRVVAHYEAHPVASFRLLPLILAEQVAALEVVPELRLYFAASLLRAVAEESSSPGCVAFRADFRRALKQAGLQFDALSTGFLRNIDEASTGSVAADDQRHVSSLVVSSLAVLERCANCPPAACVEAATITRRLIECCPAVVHRAVLSLAAVDGEAKAVVALRQIMERIASSASRAAVSSAAGLAALGWITDACGLAMPPGVIDTVKAIATDSTRPLLDRARAAMCLVPCQLQAMDHAAIDAFVAASTSTGKDPESNAVTLAASTAALHLSVAAVQTALPKSDADRAKAARVVVNALKHAAHVACPPIAATASGVAEMLASATRDETCPRRHAREVIGPTAAAADGCPRTGLALSVTRALADTCAAAAAAVNAVAGSGDAAKQASAAAVQIAEVASTLLRATVASDAWRSRAVLQDAVVALMGAATEVLEAAHAMKHELRDSFIEGGSAPLSLTKTRMAEIGETVAEVRAALLLHDPQQAFDILGEDLFYITTLATLRDIEATIAPRRAKSDSFSDADTPRLRTAGSGFGDEAAYLRRCLLQQLLCSTEAFYESNAPFVSFALACATRHAPFDGKRRAVCEPRHTDLSASVRDSARSASQQDRCAGATCRGAVDPRCLLRPSSDCADHGTTGGDRGRRADSPARARLDRIDAAARRVRTADACRLAQRCP